MADIALLVVEEYARRKRTPDEKIEGISRYGSKMEGLLFSVKETVVEGRGREVERWREQLTPKCPLSAAAFEGFFPA